MPMYEVIGLGVAGFLAWLFAAAGLHKLRYPASLEEVAGQYLPASLRGRWQGGLVMLIGVVELLVALALLLPATRAMGAGGAAILLLAYALLMAWQLLQGRRDLRCGCAGPASDVRISPVLVARNVVLAGLSSLLWLGGAPAGPSIPALGLGLGMALFLLGLYLSVEQLISNSQFMAGSR